MVLPRIKEKRAQAAMEFLMTYGWAILIILIALGVLFYLGVFNPKTPNTCELKAPFVCKDVKFTEDSVSIVLAGTNIQSGTVDNIKIKSSAGDIDCIPADKSLTSDIQKTITCTPSAPLTNVKKINAEISVTYRQKLSAVDHTIIGIASGQVEGPSSGATTTLQTGDTTAPAAIANLQTSSPTSSSITLTWTAPGDDGSTGTAATYIVRYNTAAITDVNWDTSTDATGEPAPQIAGSSETMTVSGLSPSITYYFAIKAQDEVPNTASLSNIPTGTTTPLPPQTFSMDTNCLITSYFVPLYYQYYTPWTMPGSGTLNIQRIGIYAFDNTLTSSINLKLVVYNDNNNAPGTKLAETNIFAGDGLTGWHTQSLTSPITVTAGNQYWFAVGVSNGFNIKNYIPSPTSCPQNPPQLVSKWKATGSVAGSTTFVSNPTVSQSTYKVGAFQFITT